MQIQQTICAETELEEREQINALLTATGVNRNRPMQGIIRLTMERLYINNPKIVAKPVIQ